MDEALEEKSILSNYGEDLSRMWQSYERFKRRREKRFF